MWRAEARQVSFAEQAIYNGAGGNPRLEEIARLLDWRVVEAHLAGVYAAGAGRPAYRPLLLFKALLLQQWYQLSDPGLEEALVDRLSFRRLVGLGLTQRVPDHRTLSRWRARDGRVTGWVNGCWLRSTASSRRNG
jgi:transposase, IS5 family